MVAPWRASSRRRRARDAACACVCRDVMSLHLACHSWSSFRHRLGQVLDPRRVTHGLCRHQRRRAATATTTTTAGRHARRPHGRARGRPHRARRRTESARQFAERRAGRVWSSLAGRRPAAASPIPAYTPAASEYCGLWQRLVALDAPVSPVCANCSGWGRRIL